MQGAHIICDAYTKSDVHCAACHALTRKIDASGQKPVRGISNTKVHACTCVSKEDNNNQASSKKKL